MNYVSITTSYQDGRNIVYVSSIGLGKTMAEAEDNCEKTLFKYHPQVKPYYRGIRSCQSHQSNYDFKLEDAFTELRGLDKNPELMQILLDYLPEAITRELPGIKVVSDVTTKTTPNGFVVSVDLQDRDGNEFTLDVGYGSKVGVHVSIFSDKDNRYVSDMAKGYPPQCPNIKELLNQYYKHINRARQNKEESMKQSKCSMQKKKESLSKKNEGVSASSLFAIDPKSGHSKIYDELCDIVDNVSYSGVLNAEDATDEYPDAVSVDFEVSSDDSAPYSVMVSIYGKEENDEESQLSYSVWDEYNNNLKSYKSAVGGAPLGYQKGYKISELPQMWDDLQKDIQSLVSDADQDESKKSEANLDDLKGMVVSEGTMRSEDLIPKFLNVLKTYGKDKYDAYVKENPEVLDLKGMDDETMGYVVDELFDKLDEIAPEGFYFAAHPDDGACYGFWEVDPNESKKPEACKGGKDDDKKGGKAAESKKSEGVSGTITMNIDYNTFMRLLDAAAFLDADEDYKDALWDYYSELGEIGGEALVFFDNLFQYTAWYDVDEMYDNIGERFQDESKSKEECIQDAIDDGDMTIYQYKDHYLVLN